MFADIVLTRRRGSFIRDQLIAQLEMKMLGGELAPGQRLPSIRALARMLGVDPNTVSAAYRRLEELGHVVRRRGAGVFVDPETEDPVIPPRDLDAFVHAALKGAVAQGDSGPKIREAVERWLRTRPPDRIVVFDPVLEMAELLAHELCEATSCRTEAVTVQDLEAGPADRLEGGLVVALPYQVKRLAGFLPQAAFEILTVHMPALVRRAIETLPNESSLLFVSSAEVVLKFASDLVRGLRGNDVLLHTQHLRDEAQWRPLLRVTDLVLSDVLSTGAVKASGHSLAVEFRIVTPRAVEHLTALLRLPRNPSVTLFDRVSRASRAGSRASRLR